MDVFACGKRNFIFDLPPDKKLIFTLKETRGNRDVCMNSLDHC